ncbi:MAG: M48 family metallopeptidase [Chitinophagales bacterium]|nr:M48 family metallopeptidase [Chitinophagales bacterium]MDW8273570.1 M48 family metallopeptidase [Chitinophagales bacterium]
MNFKVKYYDGKTSKAWDAKVTLCPDALEIKADYENGVLRKSWQVNKIRHSGIDVSKKVLLKYGNYPSEYIEADDPDFADALVRLYPRTFGRDSYSFFLSKGLLGLFVIIIISIVVLAAAYFYALPWVADRAALLIPIEYEKNFGSKVKENFISGAKVLEKESEILNNFFAALHVDSKMPIHITVIQRDEVNAFALPGGEIVVFSKILEDMEKPEALAALLGHEYAHIHYRHSMRTLFKSLAGYLFISVLFNDVSGIAAVLIENANNLRNLCFSRSFEREADMFALALLKKNKIDPNGAIALFSQLDEVAGGTTDHIPEFISTHPLTKERIKYMKEEIAKGQFEIAEHNDLKKLFQHLKESQSR